MKWENIPDYLKGLIISLGFLVLGVVYTLVTSGDVLSGLAPFPMVAIAGMTAGFIYSKLKLRFSNVVSVILAIVSAVLIWLFLTMILILVIMFIVGFPIIGA